MGPADEIQSEILDRSSSYHIKSWGRGEGCLDLWLDDPTGVISAAVCQFMGLDSPQNDNTQEMQE